MPKVWTENEETLKPAFLRLEGAGGLVKLLIVNANGERASNACCIATIGDDGVLSMCSCIDSDAAMRAGIAIGEHAGIKLRRN